MSAQPKRNPSSSRSRSASPTTSLFDFLQERGQLRRVDASEDSSPAEAGRAAMSLLSGGSSRTEPSEDPAPREAPGDAGRAAAPPSFDAPDLADALAGLDGPALDALPFGVIRVTDAGVIEHFNTYESTLSGLSPASVVGRNFFLDVAPCTNNRLFLGRFRDGVRRGELDASFAYTYTYRMTPTLVNIRLCRAGDGSSWVCVQKK